MATERPSAALAGPCTKFLYDLVRVYPALTLDLSTNAPPPASANPCPEARVLNRADTPFQEDGKPRPLIAFVGETPTVSSCRKSSAMFSGPRERSG